LIGCSCGHDHVYKLAAGDGDQLSKQLAKVTDQVWKKKGMPDPSKKVTALYGKHFSNAVEKGYGQKIGEIDYSTPDGNMLKHLLENVYSFSAAKNYTQLRQLTQELIDKDGKLRTYSQFKQAAFEVNDTHVNQWLKAEYDTAVSGAQMASKWVDITENDATNYLAFDVVMDGHTSEICAPLDGLVVSVDDPMLSTYYPPNHFNCRTTVRQMDSGKPTPAHQRELPEIPPMFQTNLAKQKLVFPPGHSYYVGTPTAVIKEALELAPINSWLPVENNTIRIHGKAADSADLEDVMTAARSFAKEGAKVEVLPNLSTSNDPLYETLFKGAKAGKFPDLKVDGQFVEVETPKVIRSESIEERIRRGARQADRVAIVLEKELPKEVMDNMAKNRFKFHKDLKEVNYIHNGKRYTVKRKQPR
jgi:SPP1 gp7 family putative phage head morphogenesis protein